MNFNLNVQKIVKDREEEREILRKELRSSRERIHAMDAKAQRTETPVTLRANIHTQTEIGMFTF